jgi:capsule polysaccharide modification protein KpsS
MLTELYGARVLLLQGPMSPFFRWLADALAANGSDVLKVNLNVADEIFFGSSRPRVSFRGTFEEWPAYLREVVAERRIEHIVLFGDCRPYHEQACEVASELGVEVWVFEEGYLRPDFVTLERGGVNSRSTMPREPAVYLAHAHDEPLRHVPSNTNVFVRSALFAAAYSLLETLLGWRYPHYRHHKDLHSARQLYCWARGGLRRLYYGFTERSLLQRIVGEWDRQYFLVPLQVHDDYQVTRSRFGAVEPFIREVLSSFAAHADPGQRLVFKHHPYDRPYRDYASLIRRLASEHGILSRVLYVHDLHLPTLLKHARGTVVINSTAGLSSIHHHTPTKCLGRAVYDLPGLTFQGPLDEFWTAEARVDAALHRGFRAWLMEQNQLPGSFHARPAFCSDAPRLPAASCGALGPLVAGRELPSDPSE